MPMPVVAPLDASKLTVELTKNPKPLPETSTLVFGQTFTDHMLTAKWSISSGWEAPEIRPYGPLALDPSSTVLHYAAELFEGMKAYRDKQGRCRLFRPDLNMARMNRSATRLAFPTFDGETLTELIRELVRVDERFVPDEEGCSLYIRPTMIGTRASLGVGPSTEVLLFVIMSPVAKYYSSGAKPISLLASTKDVRAWPGGSGAYKLGANYGPCVAPQLEAAQQGYQQILWVLGEDDEVTEVGMMNFWGAKRRSDGATELFTPPLGEIILPGVTRASVLALARAHADPANPFRLEGLPEDLVVSERKVTMGELRDAARADELLEVFGTGTAAIVTSVERIGYQGDDVKIPVAGGFGAMAAAFYDALQEIQYGEREFDGWSVLV